jgi:hypothetical protein
MFSTNSINNTLKPTQIVAIQMLAKKSEKCKINTYLKNDINITIVIPKKRVCIFIFCILEKYLNMIEIFGFLSNLWELCVKIKNIPIKGIKIKAKSNKYIKKKKIYIKSL